jgi:hypothetical protein
LNIGEIAKRNIVRTPMLFGDGKMRTTFLPLLVLAIGILAAVNAAADKMPGDLMGYYNQIVENEMSQAGWEASNTSKDTLEGQCLADLNRARVKFYEQNKDMLVGQLVHEGEPIMQPINVQIFLAQTFFETKPRGRIASCRIGDATQ